MCYDAKMKVNENVDEVEYDVDETETEDESDDESEGQQTTSKDPIELAKEVERLRKQNEKLKAKKAKSIEKAAKRALYTEDLESFYKMKKEQERFESEYPGIDYDVVQAVADKKGITVEEAVWILGATGRTMIGKEVTSPQKRTDKELEARKKALGLA